MTRAECRGCGHVVDDEARVAQATRFWCGACGARFYVADAHSDPEVLGEPPEACLACGGGLSSFGEPPCDRCLGFDLRPLSA